MNKKIIITGANGFIGGFLRQYFTQKGYEVIAFLRNPKPNQVQEVFFDLEKPIQEAAFEDTAYLIHCAFMKADLDPDADQINTACTLKLLELCNKYGTKMIFFSTFSAHQEAESKYGKHNLALESKINTEVHTILRPGLVLGQRGLFADMLHFARSKRIIPLIGGGHQPLQFVPVEVVAEAVENCMERQITGKFNLASTQIPSYKAFQKTLCEVFQIPALLLPIPLCLVQMVVGIGDSLKIKLPINQENILGLKHLKAFEVKEDLQKLGVQIADLKTVLQNLK